MNLWRKAIALVCFGLVNAGCSSLPGEDYGVFDPYENTNRGAYRLTDLVDRHGLQPVAKGYQAVVPNPLERGILNVFANLRGIDSAVNGFLQFKPKAGSTDLARLVINSTVGIGGLFDVASRMGLAAQNEDFGQTLAVWGIRKSRYLFVPFLGPTSVRDLPSTIIHSALPRLILGSEYNLGIGALDVVSRRAELLSASNVRDATALDPYAFTRDAYFQRRKFLIYDGQPPLEDLFDDFEFEDEDADAETPLP